MLRNHKILLIQIISVSCVFFAVAGVNAATLNWLASNGNPTGYKIYYGTDANSPSNSKDVGNVTRYNIDQLPLYENIRYYFCVSAYNAEGESATCPPVSYTPGDSSPPLPPVGLEAVTK